MNCLINDTIRRYMNKGRKVDVIARYLRMKYHVAIDAAVLKKRMNTLELNA